MKKYFILLIVSIITSVSFAQGIKFGPKLGANMGKITGSGFSDKYALGYHIGGFVEINFNKKLGIQPEILWSQIKSDTVTGFKAVYQNLLNQNSFNDLKLSYLSIPILINYRPSKIITLQVGPQFSILVDNGKNLLQNGQDAFKKGDFSLLGGVQLNLLKFRVYGRYAIGLNDISDVGNSEQWKSQTIQVGLGLAL